MKIVLFLKLQNEMWNVHIHCRAMPKNEFPLEWEGQGRNQYACCRNRKPSRHCLRKFDLTVTRLVHQVVMVHQC